MEAGNSSEKLEIVIGERLEQLAPLSDSCCIYRVPEIIRCQNPNVYAPKVVSVVPFHHGQETLQGMDEHKYRYLKDYLHRTQQTLESCIQIIRTHEAKLRSCYDENIKYSNDDFVKTILVDSAFILELMLKYHFQDAAASDRIIRDPKIDHISQDLHLLENQLPFFILEALFYPDRVSRSDQKLSLIKLHWIFVRLELDIIGVDYDSETVNSSEVKGEHFLDIARNLCLSPEAPAGGLRDLQPFSHQTSLSYTELGTS